MYGYSREKIDVGHPFGLKGLINASLMAIILSLSSTWLLWRGMTESLKKKKFCDWLDLVPYVVLL